MEAACSYNCDGDRALWGRGPSGGGVCLSVLCVSTIRCMCGVAPQVSPHHLLRGNAESLPAGWRRGGGGVSSWSTWSGDLSHASKWMPAECTSLSGLTSVSSDSLCRNSEPLTVTTHVSCRSRGLKAACCWECDAKQANLFTHCSSLPTFQPGN